MNFFFFLALDGLYIWTKFVNLPTGRWSPAHIITVHLQTNCGCIVLSS